ncbi:hypothetical protein GGX14DRAFT_587814 [Mycena pura]|uniref:Uncharacterized protein n=1 Tax=Mycena pura TaxID=153505 RepID=A0AAD6UW48_9AGAR|nr:hypothetical protein GGX14DRAFT_587814 [Mycena pura]
MRLRHHTGACPAQTARARAGHACTTHRRHNTMHTPALVCRRRRPHPYRCSQALAGPQQHPHTTCTHASAFTAPAPAHVLARVSARRAGAAPVHAGIGTHRRMRARARCSSALAHTHTSVKQWAAQARGGEARGHRRPCTLAPVPTGLPLTYARARALLVRPCVGEAVGSAGARWRSARSPAPVHAGAGTRRLTTGICAPARAARPPLHTHARRRSSGRRRRAVGKHAVTGARARWRRYPSAYHWRMRPRALLVRPYARTHVSGEAVAWRRRAVGKRAVGKRAVTGTRACWRRYPPAYHWRMRARARCSSALAHTRTHTHVSGEAVKRWGSARSGRAVEGRAARTGGGEARVARVQGSAARHKCATAGRVQPSGPGRMHAIRRAPRALLPAAPPPALLPAAPPPALLPAAPPRAPHCPMCAHHIRRRVPLARRPTVRARTVP